MPERASLDAALATIRSCDVSDPAVAAHRDLIVSLAAQHPDLAERTARPGHLTGSALVVDAQHQHLVVLHHAKLGIWVQPGGHADGDTDLVRVALREATEETGIDGLVIDPVPLDLDVHEVRPPNEDRHLHLDVRFLVIAPEGAVARANEESLALRWIRPDALPGLGADEGLRRLVAAGFARLRRLQAWSIPESR